MENNELTKNVTGWLFNALENGLMRMDSSQAENVVMAKKWLVAVNTDELLVSPKEKDVAPEAEEGTADDEKPPEGGSEDPV